MDEQPRSLAFWEAVLGKTDSPIEGAFLLAFCAAAVTAGYRIAKRPRAYDTIAVRPQQRVGKFRADFVIAFVFNKAEINIVVECDGHDFHEKTRLQSSRDKARDRFMTAQGYRMMRFTGAELHADAAKCAGEVLAMIMEFQTSRLQAVHKAAKEEIA